MKGWILLALIGMSLAGLPSCSDDLPPCPWIKMDSGTTEVLRGVWANSETDVFAVGNGGTILHYNGVEWSQMDSGTETELTSVWGSSETDVFVVGNDEAILHFNGEEWTKMNSGTEEAYLTSVFGSGPDDVYAVGRMSGDSIVLWYDGNSWSTVRTIEGGTYLEDIWLASESEIYVVGWRSGLDPLGYILAFDGENWNEEVRSLPGEGSRYRGVWGITSEHVYLVGIVFIGGSDIGIASDSYGLIRQWEESRWTETRLRQHHEFSSVWGSSEKDIVLVGNTNDHGVIYSWDGEYWSGMQCKKSYRLHDVMGVSASDVFAVGSDGTIVKRKNPDIN